MKVISTSATRVELTTTELAGLLPLPKGAEVSHVTIAADVIVVTLKDTSIARDLSREKEVPVAVDTTVRA